MILYYLYRFGRWLALVIPVRAGYRLARFFAKIKFILAKQERRYIATNLEVIRNGKKGNVEQDIRTLYENFGKYLVDFFRAEKIDKQFVEKHITIDGREHMNEALGKGNGAIGCTAHLGNWELSGQMLAVLGYKVNAIALTHKDKRINAFFLRQRMISGVKVIPVGMSVRKCFLALKRNEIVGILGDRDFSGANGVYITFLGRKMLAPRGPAVLSLRTNAPIVPLFIVRDEKNDRHFTYRFTPPLYPEKTGNEEGDIRRLTERLMRIIESYVRTYPLQWFMFREFWKAEKVEIL